MVDGRVNAWRNRAPGPHRNTARQAMDGLWTEACGQRKQSNDPGNNQHNPQYANYWAPLTRKRHIPPHSAQPRHTNYWAPRTRKRHQQEHRPQRPTERSDPTQHAKGRTGDCPGPRKGATTRRNVTRGGGGGGGRPLLRDGYAPALRDVLVERRPTVPDTGHGIPGPSMICHWEVCVCGGLCGWVSRGAPRPHEDPPPPPPRDALEGGGYPPPPFQGARAYAQPLCP